LKWSPLFRWEYTNWNTQTEGGHIGHHNIIRWDAHDDYTRRAHEACTAIFMLGTIEVWIYRKVFCYKGIIIAIFLTQILVVNRREYNCKMFLHNVDRVKIRYGIMKVILAYYKSIPYCIYFTLIYSSRLWKNIDKVTPTCSRYYSEANCVLNALTGSRVAHHLHTATIAGH
jgi:hypothetical protein